MTGAHHCLGHFVIGNSGLAPRDALMATVRIILGVSMVGAVPAASRHKNDRDLNGYVQSRRWQFKLQLTLASSRRVATTFRTLATVPKLSESGPSITGSSRHSRRAAAQ
jgi:hypothetical protein